MTVQGGLIAQAEVARATGQKYQPGQWKQRGEWKDSGGAGGQKAWDDWKPSQAQEGYTGSR
eukprot:6262220-Prorocentrum_lima.AAC.1